MNKRGTDGEKLLYEDLQYARVAFKDEEQQSVDSEGESKATPDALLTTPMKLFGHTINWIESKNSVVIPSISCENKLTALV